MKSAALMWSYAILLAGCGETEKTPLEKMTSNAKKGDPGAQNNLGLRYFNGDGVEKDLAQAVVWFRKAADQGYASAQN